MIAGRLHHKEPPLYDTSCLFCPGAASSAACSTWTSLKDKPDAGAGTLNRNTGPSNATGSCDYLARSPPLCDATYMAGAVRSARAPPTTRDYETTRAVSRSAALARSMTKVRDEALLVLLRLSDASGPLCPGMLAPADCDSVCPPAVSRDSRQDKTRLTGVGAARAPCG